MCIYSNTLFPKRAKEDIICYKVLDANYALLLSNKIIKVQSV